MPALASLDASVRARRVWPIEEAIRWTVRDELPKRRDGGSLFSTGGSVHPMWGNGLFTRVDNWSREPGMPLALGDPHPDALTIEQAINDLRPEDLDLTPYRIGYGLHPETPVAQIAARACAGVRPWLLTVAKQGRLPDHGGGPICEAGLGTRGQVTLWLRVAVQVGEGADGRPWFTESDQTTTPSRKDTYRAGTFCKLKWTRDGAAVAEDRAIYAAWHAALCKLAERLVLASFAVKPPTAPATPWIEPPTPPRTLPSLRAVNDDEPRQDENGDAVAPRQVAPLRPRPRPTAPVRRIDPAAFRHAA